MMAAVLALALTPRLPRLARAPPHPRSGLVRSVAEQEQELDADDPVYREELSLVASQLQFTIAFGPEKVREQQKLWGRRNDSLTTHGLVRLLLLQLPSRAASSPARKRLPLLMLAVYQQLLA